MEHLTALAKQVRSEMAKIIVGQADIVDQLLLVLVCNGHAVIEGVPGLAKTLAVKSLARICGLGFQRVQCTADLMPADITGTNMFNLNTSTFTLHAGPVFTDLLLVDEINRTAPRTQAALLEAMEERQVTIDGKRHSLPENFTVLATQNPVEFEGTYPLPEAQLDRFLMKIRITYPCAEDEVEILARYGQAFELRRLDDIPLTPIDPALLTGARREIRELKVEPALYSYVVNYDPPHARLALHFSRRQPPRSDRPVPRLARVCRNGRARLPAARRRESHCSSGAASSHHPETGSRSGRPYGRPGDPAGPRNGRGPQVIPPAIQC